MQYMNAIVEQSYSYIQLPFGIFRDHLQQEGDENILHLQIIQMQGTLRARSGKASPGAMQMRFLCLQSSFISPGLFCPRDEFWVC